MARTVTATEDWLSYALAEYDTDKIAASNKRAEAALKVRLDQRVSNYLKRATDLEELGDRLDVVDDSVKEIVNEVATEYGASPEHLHEAAVAAIKRSIDDYFNKPFGGGGAGVPPHGYTDVPCQNCKKPAPLGTPCPNCGFVNQPTEAPGGSLRERLMNPTAKTAGDLDGTHDAYQYERVDPDKPIGDTPASSAFQGTKFDNDVEKALDGSKDHPREFQNVADHVEDRRTLNDNDDKDEGVERAIDHQSLDSNPYTEQKGTGTSTYGDQAGAAQAVTSKFHLLD